MTVFLTMVPRQQSGDNLRDLFGGVGQIGCIYQLEARLGKNSPAFVYVGSFHPNHNRHRQLHLLRGLHHTLSQDIAAKNSAEDIDQNPLDLAVAENDAESVFHHFGIGAAADIEEVGRLGTGLLDDIHGGHGQARTVDHVADVAART